MKKKILITGGAGYVGSATVRHLLSLNYEVFVVDNLLQGSDGVTCFLGYPTYKFIKGDINDSSLMEEIIKKNEESKLRPKEEVKKESPIRIDI